MAKGELSPCANGEWKKVKKVSLGQFCLSFSLMVQSSLHALAFFTEQGVFFREGWWKMGVVVVSEL